MQIAASVGTAGGHCAGTVNVNFTSKAVAGSGLSDTALGSQTITFSGDVYNYAVANTLPTTINLGSIHAGESFTAQNLTVANTAVGGAYTEALAAEFGVPDAGITATGSVGGLAGSSSDGTSMAVGISDATAGHKTGTVAVNLTSIAVSGSGLSNTALSSQTLTVTGDVYNYAAPSVLPTAINFGSVHAGQSFTAQSLTIANTAADGDHMESLAATFGSPSEGFAATGSVAGLAGGESDNASMQIAASNGNVGGHRTGSVSVYFTSTAVAGSGLSDTALGSQTITFSGDVYGYACAECYGRGQLRQYPRRRQFRLAVDSCREHGAEQPVLRIAGGVGRWFDGCRRPGRT